MAEIWIYLGLVLLGGLFGVSAALFWVWGFNARTRVDSGQPIIGKTKVPDPLVNPSREFMDGIEQDRIQKGFEPYVNEG